MSIRDDDFSREDRGRRALKDGEWACPESKCAQVNAERITHCEGCGKYYDSDKPSVKNRVGKEIGKEMAEKSKGLFAAEDWVCSKCGNVNWARRKSCNVCNAPKLADLEKRTGYGGGYMDRQDVEYVKRDYDEEFDEFGRKKKRGSEGRGKDSPYGSDEEEEDNNAIDDDKQIGENLSKYNLNEDIEDEEDDDEDDDDDDLGKYDLTADPDLVEKKLEIVKQKRMEESDCSCSCSGGECSCEESECEKEKEHERDRERERSKVHKSSRERDRERDDRHRRGSQSKDRKRSKSRDRKRSRSRDRRRSRSPKKRRSRERKEKSRDYKRSRSRSRDRKRDRDDRRRSRSRDRRR